MVIERLARVARQGKPSAIVALQEPRRTATIAALFYTLEAAAQYDAAELAEALMVDLNNDAEAVARDERTRNQRELDAAAILLRELTGMVLEDDGLPLDRWREVLFERIPPEDLEDAVQKIDAMAVANQLAIRGRGGLHPGRDLKEQALRAVALILGAADARAEGGDCSAGYRFDAGRLSCSERFIRNCLMSQWISRPSRYCAQVTCPSTLATRIFYRTLTRDAGNIGLTEPPTFCTVQVIHACSTPRTHRRASDEFYSRAGTREQASGSRGAQGHSALQE